MTQYRFKAFLDVRLNAGSRQQISMNKELMRHIALASKRKPIMKEYRISAAV